MRVVLSRFCRNISCLRNRRPSSRLGIRDKSCLRGTSLSNLYRKSFIRDFSTSNALLKVIPFILSDVGEGIAKIQVTEWCVKEGDQISEFDMVCVAMSDKASIEITSKYTGKVVSIVRKEDNLYNVGEKMFDILIDEATDSVKDETITKGSDVKVEPPKSVESESKYKKVNLSGYEFGMCMAMKKSLSIPHFYVTCEHDISHLSMLLSELKKDDKKNFKMGPFLLKAVAMALKEHPRLNSHFEEPSTVFEMKDVDINLAINSPKGLVNPLIKDVSNLSVPQLSQIISHLKTAAVEGLNRSELGVGSFTVSNFGSIGGMFAGPIITYPQVCIGAFGKAYRKVEMRESDPDHCTCENYHYLPSSWAADHRAVSGAQLIEFTNTFDEFISNPVKFFLQD